MFSFKIVVQIKLNEGDHTLSAYRREIKLIHCTLTCDWTGRPILLCDPFSTLNQSHSPVPFHRILSWTMYHEDAEDHLVEFEQHDRKTRYFIKRFHRRSTRPCIHVHHHRALKAD